MSTIKSFDEALDFYPAADDHRPALARLGSAVRTYWNALNEGLAAAAAYGELTRRGIPHDVAVHTIFNRHFNGR